MRYEIIDSIIDKARISRNRSVKMEQVKDEIMEARNKRVGDIKNLDLKAYSERTEQTKLWNSPQAVYLMEGLVDDKSIFLVAKLAESDSHLIRLGRYAADNHYRVYGTLNGEVMKKVDAVNLFNKYARALNRRNEFEGQTDSHIPEEYFNADGLFNSLASGVVIKEKIAIELGTN